MFKILVLLWLALVLYWIVGVLVSVVDRWIRVKLNSLPATGTTIPMQISSTRVAQVWIVYVPVALVAALGWSFTRGALITHHWLYRRLFS